MTDNIPDETVQSMPRVVEDSWMVEHKFAEHRYKDAHPIDDDIVQDISDSKLGPILMHGDLAVIQAIAVREVLPYLTNNETWVEQQSVDSERDGDDIHYYITNSVSFYDLASMAHQRYNTVIKAEDIADIVHAHTRQYLRDVHDYDGDFGGETTHGSPRKPTLCNAQNDEYRIRDEEPDGVNYAYTDARGLVIQAGTHPE